jgi:hypothetical protein
MAAAASSLQARWRAAWVRGFGNRAFEKNRQGRLLNFPLELLRGLCSQVKQNEG